FEEKTPRLTSSCLLPSKGNGRELVHRGGHPHPDAVGWLRRTLCVSSHLEVDSAARSVCELFITVLRLGAGIIFVSPRNYGGTGSQKPANRQDQYVRAARVYLSVRRDRVVGVHGDRPELGQ